MSLVDSIDKYTYPDEQTLTRNKFREFLWFCAGADLQLLRHCPQSERIKEEGIGGVVLATAVLAFISSSYAFWVIFNPSEKFNLLMLIASITFGFVWSLIIFNLDRFIVSSSGHGDGTEKITFDEFLGAIPRLIMAIIIGFTLSKPLEIRVMQSELKAIAEVKKGEYLYGVKDKNGNYVIDEKDGNPKIGALAKEELQLANQRKEADEKDSELIKKKKELEDNIVELNKKQKEYEDNMYVEHAGKNGRPAGAGNAYDTAKKLAESNAEQKRIAEENLKKWEEDNRADLDARDKKNKTIFKEYEERVAKVHETADNMAGLVNRIIWGHHDYPVVSWALTLLLLSIEVAPILYKLMIRNGPYHYLTENQREIVAARYAIERQANLLAGQRGQQAEVEIYHQAETSLKSSLAHLNSESRLSLQALEKFETKVSQDIDANPEKYVQMSDPKNKA